jgi:hypothetical protein
MPPLEPRPEARFIEATHHVGSQPRIASKQAECEQVVGLATTHGLAEEIGSGRALILAFEPRERLGQQLPHTLGDVVLFKERLRIDRRQIVDAVNGVAYRRIEDRRPWTAHLPENLNHTSSP